MLQWIVSYRAIDIKYKPQKVCWQKEAISANFNFKFVKGDIFDLKINDNKLANCYSKSMGRYKETFINGKPLMLSR